MRIVILPNIGLKNLDGDADYFTYRDFILSATSRYDDMYFYLVLPKVTQRDIPALPNTTIIWVDETLSFSFSDHVASKDFISMFRNDFGVYFTDALLTSRIGLGVSWKGAIGSPYRRDAYSVILRETIVKLEEDYVQNFVPTDAIRASAFTVCPTIFENTRSYSGAVSAVNRYMSPASLEHMRGQSYVSSMAVDTDHQSFLLTKNKKHEKFTIFYGARFNSVKNPKLVFQILDKFYSSGRPVDIVMTTPTAEIQLAGQKFMKEYLVDSIRYFYASCGRAKYLEEASKCHAFVVDTGITFILEMLHLGLIGVVPDHEYVWSILPKGYPYVYRNTAEAYMWLAEIEKDYEGALRKIEPFRQHIIEQYRKEHVFEGEVDFVRKVVLDDDEKRGKLTFGVPMVQEALLEFDGDFTFSALLKVLNKYMIREVSFKEKPGGHQLTPHDVVTTLEQLGYRDTCEGPEPVFHKPEEKKS